MANRTLARSLRETLLPGTEPATTILALIGAGFFVLTVLQGGGVWNIPTHTLLRAGANFWPWTLHGEPWRLIAYGFLHGGLVHVFFNTYALLGVAPLVEQRFGTARFVFVWLASVLVGGIASALFTQGFSVGASGGVLGVLGAGIVATHRAGTFQARAVRNQLVGWAVLTVALGLAGGMGNHRFDNGAHIGGLLAGLLLGYLFALRDVRSPLQKRLENIAGTVLFVFMLAVPVALQLVHRQVPVSLGDSHASESATRADAWHSCRDALVPVVVPDFERACTPFRYVFWDYAARYEIMASAHLEAGDERQAHQERARAAALFEDRGFADVLGPRAMIDHLAVMFDHEVGATIPRLH